MGKSVQLPGFVVNEYLLVIDIPVELRERIEERRRELLENHGITQPITGRPNVSLARFAALKMNEERIIQKLQLIAAGVKPFSIELRDYAGYPMHAIFIRILNQEKVLQLIKKLKQAKRLMKAGTEEPYFLHDPTIALAGRLKNEEYLKAIKEYEQAKFSGKFMVNSFLLLRKAKEEIKYQVVKKFDFECMPVKNGQAVLFS